MDTITESERLVLTHATAWDRGRYRNRYVAGPDADVWPTLMWLTARGLMRVRFGPSPELGEMSVFEVTELGISALIEHARLASLAHDPLADGFFCRSEVCRGDKGGGVFNAHLTFNNEVRTECRCCGSPRLGSV